MCMRELLKQNKEWKHFIGPAASELPLMTIGRISKHIHSLLWHMLVVLFFIKFHVIGDKKYYAVCHQKGLVIQENVVFCVFADNEYSAKYCCQIFICLYKTPLNQNCKSSMPTPHQNRNFSVHTAFYLIPGKQT
jgi:hypothetical protein